MTSLIIAGCLISLGIGLGIGYFLGWDRGRENLWKFLIRTRQLKEMEE